MEQEQPKLRQKSLLTRTKYAQCTINPPYSIPLSNALENLSSYGCQYFAIKHDKDTKADDNGVLVNKTEHYHLILFLSKASRLQTTLVRIADAFRIDNLAQIQILSYDCLAERVQYLIHKNDANKFQYDSENIVTNVGEDELNDLLNQEISCGLSATELIQVITTSSKKSEVLLRLGLGQYNTYRNTINDLINEGLLGSNLQ